MRFGNYKDEKAPKNGYLNIEDPRLSKEHFEVDRDPNGNFLNVVDLGSQHGTWLVILNYLEDEVLHGVEYSNQEIGAFKFELGAICFTLEEIMEMYEAPEVLSDFCLLGIYALEDIKDIKEHDLDTRIQKSKMKEDRVLKVKKYIEKLRREYELNRDAPKREIFKTRLILKIIAGQYKGVQIEVGYRGTKIGLVKTKDVVKIVFTSFQHSDTFDENLFDINFKNGRYYLKSYGFSRIYKKFNPHESNKIYPGHRICAGSQIFTLLQHIHFHIGESQFIIFEEFTNISDAINISIYAIVQE